MQTQRHWSFFPRHIRGLLVALILVVLLPLLLVQVGVFHAWYQTRRTAEFDANAEMAAAVRMAVETYLLDVRRQEFALGMAMTHLQPFNRQEANTILRESAERYTSVRRFIWVNPAGIAIASSDPKAIGINYSDRDYITRITRGGRSWAVSNLMASRVNNEPVFTVTTGFRQGGKLQGILIASVHLDAKAELSLRLRRNAGAYYSIIDQQGQVIYTTEQPNLSMPDRDWSRLYPQLRTVLKTQRPMTAIFPWGVDGSRRMVCLTPVSTYGWAVSASRSEAIAMAPVRRLLLPALGLSLATTVLAVVLALGITRRVVMPLRRLEEGARTFSVGDWGHRVAVTGPVELQRLAETFNTMADTVQTQQEELAMQNEELQAQHEELHAQHEELQCQQEELAAQNEELAAQSEELHAQNEELQTLSSEVTRGQTFLRSVVAQMPAGVLIVEAPTGSVYHSSAQRAALWRHTTPLTDGHHCQESHPLFKVNGTPYTPEEEPLARALRGQTVSEEEVSIARGDGTPATLLVNAAPIIGSDNELLGAVMIEVDLSEHKQLEQVLAQERAFLAAAINLLPLPALFVGCDEQLTLENAASEELFGPLDREHWWQELVLCMPDTLAPIPRDQRPFIRALAGEEIRNFAALLRLSDGRRYPVLLHAAPVRVDGKVVAAVEVVQDISSLKEEDMAKNQFLAVLSHELLTPVTSMLGWAQVAQDDLNDTATVAQAFGVIERNARRQKRLVDDLLDLSRIIHGKLSLTPEPIALWSLVEQQAETAAQMARERDLTIHLEPPTEPLVAYVDPARTGQAIANLINNACKFTETGGSVTLAATLADNEAVLTVTDTGRGIPGNKLHELFNPFRQLDRDERAGGLGLGLALVKGIVELQQGRIIAASPGPGKGSTFTIYLPLATAERTVTAQGSATGSDV